MLGSNFKDSFLHLTLLAFVISCSAAAPAPTYKKSTADSKKKPAQSDDADADAGDEGASDDAEAGDDDEEESSEDDEGSGEPDSDEAIKDPEKPVDDGDKEPVVMKPVEPTPAENVASLDNFRWAMLCEEKVDAEICKSNIKVDTKKTIAGKASEVYEVELRFRGVVEPMKYKDGQKVGERFYVGGSPNDGTYNIYSIEVSNPKQIYYLNWSENTGHITFALDYTAKIKINGGATVHLVGNGQNDKMISNFKNVVAPGVEKLPMDNMGQFIQMNVVGAVLSN